MAKICLTESQKAAQLAKDVTKDCKKLLRAEGITQQQVAEMVGCTQEAICYELNHTVSLKVLSAVAMLTGKEILK